MEFIIVCILTHYHQKHLVLHYLYCLQESTDFIHSLYKCFQYASYVYLW